MSRYKVMVDDNFHYMEEDERWELGAFATLEEAIAACRDLVDRSLRKNHKPAMTAAQLLDWCLSFGDDPLIAAAPGEGLGVSFSAHAYAQSRAEELCAAPPSP